MDLGLAGVPIAVAGASRGLGYAVAHALASEGARVAICSRAHSDLIEAASRISTKTGSKVIPIPADLSTEDGPGEFISTAASELGGLAGLVTNSGGPPPGPPEAQDDRAWQLAIDLNLMSTIRMCRAALPHFRRNGWGRIVCITSSAVKQPLVGLSLSSVARSAATAFAKTLSDQVAAEGITVNCVMPGQILTDRLRELAGASPDASSDSPEFAEMISRIPTGRLGRPEELAAVVAFLCSRQASFVNGINLAVDGGYLRTIV